MKATAPGPGQADAPDLDAWRAEAGEAARLATEATPDWTQAHHIDEPRAIVSLDDMTVSLLALDRDGMAIFDRVEDAAFAAAARTGWPRDAARVGVLAAEVARLAALESVAINHHDTCLGACGCGVCAWIKASRKEGATR